MQSAVASIASIPRTRTFVRAAPRVEIARAKSGQVSWRTDPDVVAMERVRDGDMDSFQVLFTKYSGALVKFAYRFLRSRDRAEEVAQTAFLQLYRARKRYKPKARFATFLYRIATNLCLNELRKFEYSGKIDSLNTPDDSESGGSSWIDRLPDHESSGPARCLASREAAVEVRKLLQHLPPTQRMAVLLSRVDGLSYQEVAEDLGTSVSAVKSLIFRATATLRRELGDLV